MLREGTRPHLVRFSCVGCIVALAAVLAVGQQSAPGLGPDEVVAELRRISLLSNGASRLREYDELAAKVCGEMAQSKGLEEGKWRASSGKSRMDDSTSVTLRLKAEEDVSGWPAKRAQPELVLRYLEGQVEAYISLGLAPAVESNDVATITVRFDKKEAMQLTCGLSTSRDSVFVRDAKAFIREVRDSETMLLRFVPYNSDPVMTEFDTRGARAVLPALESASGWRLDDQAAWFEERVNRGKYDLTFSSYIHADGVIVTVEVEGAKWLDFARDRAAKELIGEVLAVVREAGSPWPQATYRITAFGTTWPGEKGGTAGKPFSSAGLLKLCKQALGDGSWDDVGHELAKGPEREPEYYDEKEFPILKGKVKRTGEMVVIELVGIEK